MIICDEHSTDLNETHRQSVLRKVTMTSDASSLKHSNRGTLSLSTPSYGRSWGEVAGTPQVLSTGQELG